MAMLLDHQAVAQRVLDHIDAKTTDLSATTWREPVERYRSEERLVAEIELVLRRNPSALCPSAALPEIGSYVARDAAGTPVLAVRGADGEVRAFRNACRHRGMQLAGGAGCAKAFVCGYHGWTYRLDGRLRHVPHEYGFPGLDKDTRGLVPIPTNEQHGLVFLTQEEPSLIDTALDELSGLLAPSLELRATAEREEEVNWKILVEGFLEGYHIRSTHRETFFPVQFDNINLVETFGRNSRVTFPFQNIAKLRAVPPARRSVDGVLTFVYHLFPNVIVATFPGQIVMVALEPLAVDRTRMLTYALTDDTGPDVNGQTKRDRATGLLDAGNVEDLAVARSIQRGLASGANEFFEFGRFEGAIGHFHRELDAVIDGAGERAPDRAQPVATAIR